LDIDEAILFVTEFFHLAASHQYMIPFSRTPIYYLFFVLDYGVIVSEW
jgi:hypothetical protein